MFLNYFQVQSEVGMPIGNVEFPACFLQCLGAGGLHSSV